MCPKSPSEGLKILRGTELKSLHDGFNGYMDPCHISLERYFETCFGSKIIFDDSDADSHIQDKFLHNHCVVTQE